MCAHPDLTAELDLTERLSDPVAERLDAVIRIGALADSSLIATKLAEQKRLLVASPAYLAQRGTPAGVAALAGHRLLDKLHGADLLGWADVLGGPVQQAVFRPDDFEALRSAALAGMGVALLPAWVVGPDVRTGALTHIGLDRERWNEQSAGIHLLRALPQPPAKLREFIDAMRAFIGSPPCWEP